MSIPPLAKEKSCMTESDRIHEVVREWVEKAENDLLACTILLKSGSKSPTEIVCFHAQQ